MNSINIIVSFLKTPFLICILLGGMNVGAAGTVLPIEKKIKVVVSFSILEDIVSKIGGTRVEVITIIGRGVDPHSFEMNPLLQKKIANADLFLLNGLGFESWIDNLKKSLPSRRPQFFEVSQGIEAAGTVTGALALGAVDPHLWHDPLLGIKYVENVRQALCLQSPKDCDFFRTQSNNLVGELKKLDQSFSKSLEKVSLDCRKVLISHNFLRYFASRYQIKVISMDSLTSHSQEKPKEIMKILEQIKKEKVSVLFFEGGEDSRFSELLSKEAKLVLKGPLYADFLSKENGKAGSYIKLLEFNFAQIKESFCHGK